MHCTVSPCFWTYSISTSRSFEFQIELCEVLINGGTFKLSDETWPFQKVSGWYVVVKGSVHMSVIRPSFTLGQCGMVEALNRLPAHHREKGQWAHEEPAVVMGAKSALFVPYGMTTVVYGLPKGRCTAPAEVKVASGKKKKAGAEDDEDTVALLFIPCLSAVEVKEGSPETALSVYQSMLSSEPHVPPGIASLQSWKDFVKVVKERPEQVAKTSTLQDMEVQDEA